ncbi:MAG: phenylalanine--tRNA ligase subunit beta [Myxococcota bacterium]
MLISCNWLQRHVDLEGVDHDELAERFTLNVAELEDVHRIGAGLRSVVVGHVRSAEPVEGTKLRYCEVDAGEGHPRKIVCGAPNVAAGQKVPVVLPGTTVDGLTIEKRKVRGLLSEGMIASEKELGLSEEHAGIMVLDDGPAPGSPAVGTPLSHVVGVEDVLLEIDNKSLTHRPDLWGHRGIAREVAAILGRPLKPMELDVDFTDARPLTVEVEDREGCPRYTAATLEGVTVRPSPLWLRVLLHRVGVRAINRVVDATNFVMLDVGNPLHAFDRRQIAGDTIVVRRARDGESFTTLDDVERTLDARDLLIADAERGIALAGIMGGANSEIRDDTRELVLESANFDPATIRLSSTRLGLRTDSSARFEKSLDPHLAETASRAFIRLLQELDPEVKVTSALMDVHAPLPEPPEIDLRVDRVHRRLGVDLGEEAISRYLKRLHFGVEEAREGVLRVTVPTFRATKDIAIEEDLIEEIGRSYGYDHVPPQPPRVVLDKPHPNERKTFERAARGYLTRAAGLDEVMTYSFAFDPLLERIDAVPERRVLLENAISAEMPALRTDLAPNLLGVLEKNARNEEHVGVFELGRVFRPAEEAGEPPVQPVMLGGLLADATLGEDPDAALFFALEGVLAGLARAVERPTLEAAQGRVHHPWAHPARQAALVVDGRTLGYLAEVHPMTLHSLDVPHRVALFEVDLDAWRALEPAPTGYTPLARYPAVYRDFAVVVEEAIRASAVRDAIRAAAPETIREVTFQSVFRGRGVAEGHKSMAWSVTMRHDDRTLTDPEVREVEEAVWRSLADRVGGTQRA